MGRYLAIPLLLLLAGCGYQQLQQGEPNFNTAILLPGYTSQQWNALSARDVAKLQLVPVDLPAVCNANPATTDKTVVSACVYAVVAIIDDQYREYRITLHHLVDNGNAAADITVLGLTTAATGPIGATTAKVLTGVAAFVTGSKSVINQDLLVRKAIEDIIHQMDTDRATRLTNINNAVGGAGYTLAQAKDDLLLYFAAGTWDSALTSIETTLATNQTNCQAQADQAKANQAQTTAGAAAGGGAPAATATNCPPAASPPPALTIAAAKANTIFAVSTGAGYFKVQTAAASQTGTIAVIYSADGKSFTGAAMNVPFATFVGWVKPTPVTP